jgi:hypothetical protein
MPAHEGCWSNGQLNQFQLPWAGKPSCKIRLTRGEETLHSLMQAVVKWML